MQPASQWALDAQHQGCEAEYRQPSGPSPDLRMRKHKLFSPQTCDPNHRRAMDGLSVASGIAGIVSVTDIVVRALIKYVSEVKDAKKEISALLTETSSLYGILRSLELLACQFQNEPVKAGIQTQHLHYCYMTLERLRRLLEDAYPSKHERPIKVFEMKLRWPISKPETEKLVDELQRHKATLNLALAADGMSALLQALSRQNEIGEDVREIKTELKRQRNLTDTFIITQQHKNIIDFFTTADPQITLDANIRLQQPGTGLWFTEGEEFQSWLEQPGSKLWINGIPGAGKTILMSLIIERVKASKMEDDAVAYFFCDYKNTVTHDPSNILKSLAKQLALQGQRAFSVLEQFYKQFHGEGNLPTVLTPEALRDLVIKLCLCFSHSCIIVDGLDECGGDRSYVVRLLSNLNNAEANNVKLLLASRDEPDIRRCLQNFIDVSIAARSSDLKLYVAAEVQKRMENGTLTIRQNNLKSHIMEVLVEKAAGM